MTNPTKLSLRTPADLVEVLPYLLGYTPEDRVSVIYLASGRIVCVASAPLESGVEAVAPSLADPVYTARATAAFVFGHADSAFEAWRVAAHVAEELTEHVAVQNILACTAEGWAEVSTDIPWELKPYRAGMVTAESVYAGMTKANSRSELAARIAPNPEHIAALAALPKPDANGDDFMITEAQRQFELAEALRTLPGRKLTASDVQHVTYLLNRGMVADLIMTMKQEDARGFREVFEQMVTYYADDAQAQEGVDFALALVGFCAWIDGDGATVCLALDRLAIRRRAGLIVPAAADFCDFMEKTQRAAVSPRGFLSSRDEA